MAALRIRFAPLHRPVGWPALLAVAQQHHLTACDAAYLELALRTGLPLATLDDALVRAAQDIGVRLVGGIAEP